MGDLKNLSDRWPGEKKYGPVHDAAKKRKKFTTNDACDWQVSKWSHRPRKAVKTNEVLDFAHNATDSVLIDL